jgi:transcription antitermination factor NusG
MLFRGAEPWLALQVVPRHEKKVDTMLEYRGYAHFLPTRRVRQRWSDRVKVIEQPLFPGYVFCRRQRTLIEVVRSTPGIIRIVCFGGKPHPMPDQEIEALQRLDRLERDVASFPYLRAGQKVQVISGPLAGIVGMIVQFKNRNRLIISVDLIMKSVSVEIEESEVALDHPPPAPNAGIRSNASTRHPIVKSENNRSHFDE